MSLRGLIALSVCLLPAAAIAQQADLLLLEQQAVRAAAASVADSVVQVETLGGLERVGSVLIGTGPTSGLIVSADGYIVSSAFNFIQQPSSILVTLSSGERRPATIVARDRSRMLVLLKVDTATPLAVPLPASRDQLQVGQTVIALGKAIDPTQANLSVGILSALNRIWGRAVQTDANISPLNYGGPLIDLYGRVIGILVPLSPESDDAVAGVEWYDSGIGFAAPLEDLNQQLDRLKSGEDLKPGKLGIVFDKVEQLDPEPRIAVVKRNSPAAQIGLQPGDRILTINSRPVERHSHVRHALGPLYAGDAAALTVARGDATLSFTATLTDVIPPYEHAFLGLLAARRDLQTGVGIRFVFPNSPLAAAGLLAGDRLLKLNDQPLQDANQLRTLLANLRPDDAVQLTWQRDGAEQTSRATLGRLPEAIPGELPPPSVDGAAGSLATGKLPIELPEEPNRCTAYVPTSVNRGHQAGLLLLLTNPGDIKVDELIESWRGVCEERDLVLLLPEPQDAARWQPTEVDYMRKVIDQAVNRFDLDPQRVVVAGEGAGGAMAYLAGLRHRELVRGIVGIDAPVPSRLGSLENEPLLRLAVLAMTSRSSPLSERISPGIKGLRELKFPVTELERDGSATAMTDGERTLIGRWVDNLDRL